MCFVQVADVQSHLKSAIARSHPPTAKYLVETAIVCLDHGVEPSNDGFQLRPVQWVLVADVVSRHCPNVELLEKLCGKTGQKYFALLGNTDEGLPEFVLADVHALISSPKHSPSVAAILSLMPDKSWPQRNASIPAESALQNGGAATAEASSQAPASKHLAALAAESQKQGSSKGLDASFVEPPPGFAPLHSPVQPDTKKAAPTPAPAPSSNASTTDAGSSEAMQALLSACMQLPAAPGKVTTGIQVAPANTKLADNSTASISGLAVGHVASAFLPSSPLSRELTSKAEAVVPNGIANGNLANADSGSSSSSASSISEAMKARSSASTDLSNSSPAANDHSGETSGQHSMQDPFCIDCVAQPGLCKRHPLVPGRLEEVRGSEQAVEDAGASSECSSQVLPPLDLAPHMNICQVSPFISMLHAALFN